MRVLARVRVRFLTRAERERTHGASLRILEETGALVRSAEARRLLAKAGAKVAEGDRVRFPENLIADALRSAPKSFVLGARDSRHDLRIPAGDFPYLCTDGFPVKIWDYGAEAPRASTRADLERWVTLADAVPSVDFVWPSVTPTDLPPETAFVGGLRTSYEHTVKHVQYQAITRDQARAEIAMARVVAGTAEENRKRPHVSSVACIIAPLQYDAGTTDAVVEFAHAGIPVVAMTMVTPGITGPVTLAGSLALANAEVLGSLAISHAARVGSPVFYCFVCAPLDMKTGGFVSGSPEYAVLSLAGAEMARHYGLPSMMGGFGNTSKASDFQLGYEKALTTSPVALAGCDLLTGLGGLVDSSVVCLEQVLLDAEIWEQARRVAKGLEVTEAEVAREVIEAVGPRGQFLRHPHTLANFRRLYRPGLGDRSSFEAWDAGGRAPILEAAHEEVERILANHRAPPLPAPVEAELLAIERGMS